MATRKKTTSRATAKNSKPVRAKVTAKASTKAMPTSATPAAMSVNSDSVKQLLTGSTMGSKIVRALVWVVIVTISFMGVDYFAQYLDNDYFVAVVNNERISQKDFNARLKQVAGEQVAETLIQEQLIYQEADKKGIKVSTKEIDDEVDSTIERVGGQEQFDLALESNGYTMDSYRTVVKLNLLAARLVVDEPTDADLEKFFTENKDQYFKDQAKYSDDKELVIYTYRNQKLEENFAEWYQNVKADSVIQNNITAKPEYGMFKRTRALLDKIYSSVTGK
ncbi:MAG: hypothetical protein Fur003_6420 [Candidatus Dojkabacteria bacterium]